jgi:hypothetical protein
MSLTAIEGSLPHKKVRSRDISITLTVYNIQGYDPVKVYIKNTMGPDWIIACMIPRGNMMASILKKTDDQNGFKLVNFNCSNKKETPKENIDLENDFKTFLEQGISSLVRDGEFFYLYNTVNTLNSEKRTHQKCSQI